MSRTIVIQPPHHELLVRLEDAKMHLRVRHNDDDDLIHDHIKTAVTLLDGPGGLLGRAIGEQVLEHRRVGFGHRVTLPYPPANFRTPMEVLSVSYVGSHGEEVTVLPERYRLDGRDLVSLSAWPPVNGGPEGVRIRYRTGSALDDVDSSVKTIVRMMVADLYRMPESVVIGTSVSELQISTATRAMIDRLRVDVLP